MQEDHIVNNCQFYFITPNIFLLNTIPILNATLIILFRLAQLLPQIPVPWLHILGRGTNILKIHPGTTKWLDQFLLLTSLVSFILRIYLTMIFILSYLFLKCIIHFLFYIMMVYLLIFSSPCEVLLSLGVCLLVVC